MLKSFTCLTFTVAALPLTGGGKQPSLCRLTLLKPTFTRRRSIAILTRHSSWRSCLLAIVTTFVELSRLQNLVSVCIPQLVLTRIWGLAKHFICSFYNWVTPIICDFSRVNLNKFEVAWDWKETLYIRDAITVQTARRKCHCYFLESKHHHSSNECGDLESQIEDSPLLSHLL